MDVKEYIASGILEAYLLGSVSEQEKKEVECMVRIYPELKTELDSLSLQLELMARAEEVKPSSHITDSIMKQIAELAAEENKQGGTNVVPIHPPQKSPMRFAVAAGLALLVATSVFLYSELQNQNRKIAGMQLQINESKGKIIEGRNQLALYKDQLTLARSTAVKQIILTGTPKHADATAIVYWNTENKNVYITASNLPAPPETHDYQLWAIVDGKPTDMGVIRFNEAASMIIAAGNVSTAQAFAITLETKGGNPSPNLDQLYVIAQI